MHAGHEAVQLEPVGCLLVSMLQKQRQPAAVMLLLVPVPSLEQSQSLMIDGGLQPQCRGLWPEAQPAAARRVWAERGLAHLLKALHLQSTYQ